MYQSSKVGGQQHINNYSQAVSLSQLQRSFEGGNQDDAQPTQEVANEGDVNLPRMLHRGKLAYSTSNGSIGVFTRRGYSHDHLLK